MAHNKVTEEHNAQEPTLDHANIGAVQAFNDVSASLNAEKATFDQEKASCSASLQQLRQNNSKTTGAGIPGVAPKSPRGPPTAVELANASLNEKANDPAYLDLYYVRAGPDGELRRKDSNALDRNGIPVPLIRQDPADATKYIPVLTAADNAMPPVYRLDTRARESASLPVWMGVAEEMSARSLATLAVQAWEAQKSRELDATGAIDPLTAASLSQAYVAQRDTGEVIGQYAGKQFMDVNYPAEKFDARLISDPSSTGSGVFDKVYEVTDKATGRQKILILEEKAPSAGFAVRMGLDGRYYKQGARGYYDSVVANLAARGTPIEKDLADKLLLTQSGDIDYVLVRANVAEEKKDGVADQRYDGFTSIAFDLKG
ncbi:hypothetical protein [Nocardia sp. NPDC006630]|uniref:hypothetical protein n=1 Tax=Nocardia sp. NPDC006630 TaxID=3157181 RepID=UPI0033B9BD36